MNVNRESDGSTLLDHKLFWACFISLIATAFAFMLRVMLMDTWALEFNLSETEKGQVFGAGFWPFGISIVVFSLFIDRIGYGKAFAFAFACHIGFAVMTYFATGYDMLYWGSVIGALGNGTIEAAINPLIATVFWRHKTKWLNILHAGWPGGLVVTGFVMLLLPASIEWRTKILLILIPTLAYGVMMLRMHFPVSERVAAGVSHRDMVREMGWAGAFIVAFMVMSELSNTFGLDDWLKWSLIVAITLAAAAYVRSFGRPMFVFLLLVMILLATTELGTDAWIKDLMKPVIASVFGIDSGWVLVYTAFLMMMLRFFSGPIVKALQPLGILAASSALVAVGIFSLSVVDAAGMIFIAATIYGIGQTYFWPTTLGFVSEQFPRGGAMTINVIAGVGMLGVGVLGNAWLGYVQDSEIASELRQNKPAVYAKYTAPEKDSVFGSYVPLDKKAIDAAPPADKEAITEVQNVAKKSALQVVGFLPLIMLACYLALIFWFKARGGYKPVHLHPSES